MDTFLEATKSLSVASPVHAVLGNESCDLDSAVSAVVYAFFLATKKHAVINAVPVLNIHSQDYALRTEVVCAFSKFGIKSEHLTFRDQIDLSALSKDGNLQLSLVDHNKLAQGDEDLDQNVVEVIDHHAMERADSPRVDLTVEPVGSCSTLIAEKILSDSDAELPHEALHLLYGIYARLPKAERFFEQYVSLLSLENSASILVDTINLSESAGKAKPKDWKIIEELECRLGGPDRKQLFDELQQAKFDVSGLSTNELLRKDLKVAKSCRFNVAVSSIPVHIKDFLETDNVEEELAEFCQEQAAAIAVVMTLYVEDNGEPSRQIAVFSQDKILLSQMTEALQASTNPDLKLSFITSKLNNTETISIMSQGNIDVSSDILHSLINTQLNKDKSMAEESVPTVVSCEDPEKEHLASADQVRSHEKLNNVPVIISPVSDGTADLLGLGLNNNNNTADKGLEKEGSRTTPDPFVNHTNILIDGSPLATPDLLTPEQAVSPAAGSYPATPPNSHMEPANFSQTSETVDRHLPSFNNFEMVRKIREKKALLDDDQDDATCFSGAVGGSPEQCPFTPQNSFTDTAVFQAERELPSLNNMNMVQAVKRKRASQTSVIEPDSDLTDANQEEADTYPFTPANSESGDELSRQKYDLGIIAETGDMVQVIQNKRASLGLVSADSDCDKEKKDESLSPAEAVSETEVEITQELKEEINSNVLHSSDIDSEGINEQEYISSASELNHQELEALAELEDVINSADELDKSDGEYEPQETLYEAEEELKTANDNNSALKGSDDNLPLQKLQTSTTDEIDALSPDSAIDVETSPDPANDKEIPEMVLHSDDAHTDNPASKSICDSDNEAKERYCDVAQLLIEAQPSRAEAVMNLQESESPTDSLVTTQHENMINIRKHSPSSALTAADETWSGLEKSIQVQEASVSATQSSSDTFVTNSKQDNGGSRKKVPVPPVESPGSEPVREVVLQRPAEENFPEEVVSPENAHVKRKQPKPGARAGTKSSNWKQTLGLEWDSDDDDDDDDDGGRDISADIMDISLDDGEPTEKVTRPNTLDTSAPKKKIVPNIDLLNDDDEDAEMDVTVSSSSSVADGVDGSLPPLDNVKTPDDITTPDAMGNPVLEGQISWENTSPSTPVEPIPEYTAREEYEDNRHWRTVEVGSKTYRIDMKVIEPYKKVLSHGGYYGEGFNALIVFAACYLPDRSRKDYQYVMDNLFLYVISTLELLVVEDYMIIYFHGSTPKNKMPGLRWLKRCYDMIDRRLRKNLKGLLVVHPTLWLKTVVVMTRPFISSKFSSKLHYVRSLHDLTQMVPTEYIYIPDEIKAYDRRRYRSSVSSSTASTPS